MAAAAALVLTGGNIAWATGSEAAGEPPSEPPVLVAEVGPTAEDGSVALLAPSGLDHAKVLEVLPTEGRQLDEDEAVLVVEVDRDGSGPEPAEAPVRVTSPRAGVLVRTAEVGDEVSAGDVVAGIAASAPPTASGEDPGQGTADVEAVTQDDGTVDGSSDSEASGAEDTPRDVGGEQSGTGGIPGNVDQSGGGGAAVTDRAGRVGASPRVVGDSTITVTKRTMAQPLGNSGSIGTDTSNTVGAVFQLHTFSTTGAGPGQPVPDPWASCTITAGSPGECVITVPDTQQGGVNHDKQFWVVETSPATGTYANPVLKVGDFQGPQTVRRSPGLTPRLSAGAYEIPRDARSTSTGQGTAQATNQERSFGAVADSLDNPVVAPSCDAGVDIALQLDLSPSIDAGELAQYRNALAGTNGLLDSLAGTNSRVSMYTFNSTSPGQNSPAGWNHTTPLNVDEGTNLATLKARVNGLTQTGGATNWDRALRVVSQASEAPDVLMFITDGAPNYITGPGGGNTTDQPDTYNVAVRSVEAAIYSANAVKAQGTRVLAVGVGGGITHAGENLRAVSGTTPGSDYFQTQDWGQLGAQLREIAQQLTCQVPITVSKHVTDEHGQNPEPAQGWDMGVSLSAGTTGAALDMPAATATGADGTAGPWTVRLDSPQGSAGVDVTETMKDGYTFTSATYTITHADGTITTGTFDGVSGQVPDLRVGDRVDVAYVNTPAPRTGTFDVTKALSNPDGVTGLPNDYTITYTVNGGAPQTLAIAAGATSDPVTVPAGAEVTLRETPPGALPGAQWASPSWTVGGQPATPDGDGKVTFTVPAGTHVSAQVTNTITKKTAPFSIRKDVVGSGKDLVPGGTVFLVDYFVNGSATASGQVALRADGTQVTVPGLRHGDTVTFREVTPLPAVPGVDWGSTVITPATLTIDADAATAQLVTVTNTANIARVGVEKSDGSVTQLVGGNWQVDYTVEVHNETTTATTYTLTDTPDPGTGFTVVSEGWQGASPGTDTPIAAGATHSYTYRVVASFDPAVPDPELTCDPVEGGAFFNSATVTFPGGSDSDTGCGAPASPTVTKTGAAATQNPVTGYWTISYDITVTNGSGIQLAYDLSDTAAALPGGVNSVGDWTVTGPVMAPAGAGSSTPVDSWNGSGRLATGLLPAGATHTFTVQRTVAVGVGADPGDLECSATPAGGGGLWNSATVTNGVGSDEGEACVPVEVPGVDVAKSVVSTVQGTDGSWTVVYDVVVTNDSESVATRYSLSDDLHFGGDITVSSAAWTGPGDTSGTFGAGETSAVLAADRVLAGGGVETYRVTVVALVDAEAWGQPDAQLTCPPGGDGAGGFLNSATVTFPGGSDSDEDCSQPAVPTVTKTGAAAAHDNGDGTWTITYTVAAANPSDVALHYALTDSLPELPDGFSLEGPWAFTPQAGTPGEATTATGGVVELFRGQLAGGATHTWDVAGTLRVSAAAQPGELEECPGGERARGVVNSATVSSAGYEADDDACVPVEVPAVGVAKSVVSTVQGSDGSWTVVYDVVVTNTSESTGVYSLSDDLHFGGDTTVSSAAWTGPGDTSGTFAAGETSAVLATDRVLAGGGVETYRVTVVALVDAEAWGQADAQLTCPPGGDGVGGFLNSATVTFPGGSDSDEDCSEPSLPGVTKDFVSATQSDTDASRWTVVYKVTVKGGQHDTFYDLADVPSFAEGVEILSGSAQRTDTDPVGDPVALEPGGGTIATGVALVAGGEHTYRVTWLVDIDEPVAPEVATCGETPTAGHGFFNSAVLTVGGVEIDDDACGPVDELVVPTVDKEVVSTVQNGDGTWTVVYSVTVSLPTDEESNPQGLGAEYDLVDTLDFGEGLDVIRAGWTGPGGTTGDFDLASGTATLATDATITPGTTPHVYVVTVDADVTTEAVTGGTLECRAPEGADAGGFLNSVRLTSAGTEQEDTACSDPAVPTIAKTGMPAHRAPDGTWDVGYLVTVSNPEGSDHTLVYRLTDTPEDLPEGVELVEGTTWTASDAQDGTPDPVEADRPDEGDWLVGEGSLVPGESHGYLISARVIVVQGMTFEFEECGDVGTTGIVLPNLATLGSGTYRVEDEGCTTVLPPPRWTLHKASEPPSGSTVAAGSRITYTLTVTNTGQVPVEGAVVEDDLSEVLDHAALVGDLPDELSLDGTTLTWVLPEDVGVGESASVSYTVRVDPGASGVRLRNVATPASPGGVCLEGACTTTHRVPTPPVTPGQPVRPFPPMARTGADAEVLALLALASLAAGATLVGRRRWSVRNR